MHINEGHGGKSIAQYATIKGDEYTNTTAFGLFRACIARNRCPQDDVCTTVSTAAIKAQP